ncbi:MAG: hypothetical protein ACYS32_17110 [Planctomycetota bacterium]|jgi:hypothetical protein
MSFKIPDWLGYEIREKWEGLVSKLLDVRRWINRRDRRIIIGVTVVTVVIFVVIVIGLVSEPEVAEIREYKKSWYYDLNTSQLFTARKGLIPPIDAPSGPLPDGGPAGVKAHVFTYVPEPNESERFVGFLETTDPNADINSSTSAMQKTNNAASWGHGKLFRRVDDEKWVLGSSRKGRAILEEALLPNDKGERPLNCRPK